MVVLPKTNNRKDPKGFQNLWGLFMWLYQISLVEIQLSFRILTSMTLAAPVPCLAPLNV